MTTVRSGTQLTIALCASLAFHLGAGAALLRLARRPKPPPRPATVTISVVDKKPPKPEEPKPEPPKPKPVPMKLARAPKLPPPPQDLPPPPPVPPPQTDLPPPPSSEAKNLSTTTPVILSGITLESTTASGGFAVNVGNTLYGDPGRKGRDPAVVKPYKAERYAPAAQVSELPEPLNRDQININKYYPVDARKKEFEGEVVLKLLIDSDGSIAKVDIISDPGEGLGAAAARAILEYRFSPGKVNGVAVATTVPFKITFVIN